jgi:hypothetical protein
LVQTVNHAASACKEWHFFVLQLRKHEQLKRRMNEEVAKLHGQRKQLSVKQRLQLKVKNITLAPNTAAYATLPVDPAQHSHFTSLCRGLDRCAQVQQSTAALLCSLLPSRFCCNNPACSSLSTASESFMLVRGQSCVCGGCLMGSRRPVLAPTFCTAAR